VRGSLLARPAGIGTIAAIAAFSLAACSSSGGSSPSSGSSSGGGSSTSLNGSGSTFQANIETEWTAKYTGGKVSYNSVGTGTGQQQFADGTVDFGGEDVVMPSNLVGKVTSTCNGPMVQVPVTAGGIAVIYNLPGISNLKLDAAATAKIFQHQITKWNDPAIAALNPGVSLPSTAITVYHRADGSGTTAVFSGWLDNQAKGVWNLGVSEELNWPKGTQGAQGSSGTTQGVQQTSGGITYAEESYVKSPLKAAVIKNAKGQYVAIGPAAVSQSIGAGYQSHGVNGGSMAFQKMTGYPISTVSFIAACQAYSDSSTGSAVKNYLTYIVTQGQSYAAQLAYAPLAPDVVSTAKTLIAKIS
jgi:phosphate transport system substrate-binding protein